MEKRPVFQSIKISYLLTTTKTLRHYDRSNGRSISGDISNSSYLCERKYLFPPRISDGLQAC
jgi:hypothetical protein